MLSRWRQEAAKSAPAKKQTQKKVSTKPNLKESAKKKQRPLKRRSRIFETTRTSRKARGDRSLLRTQIVVGIVIVVVLSMVVGAVYYATRLPAFQITAVEVTGGFTIPHETIQTDVETLLQGTYFKLIPRTFVYTYPHQAILDTILHIPRVKDARLAIRHGHTLDVAFDEYQPFALWCRGASSSQCAFLDRSGYAFAAAPELTGNAFVRYQTPTATSTAPGQVIAPQRMGQTTSFIDRLKNDLDLYVTTVDIVGDGDIDYTVSGGGMLKTSTDMPPATTFANLQTILSSATFHRLESGKFDYIDLRFGDKVFVNEHGTSTNESVGTSTTPAS